MRVELTRGIIWDKMAREPGEVLEVSEVDGFTLIDKGKARLYKDPVLKTTNRSVGLETSEPEQKVTKRRTTKKKLSW